MNKLYIRTNYSQLESYQIKLYSDDSWQFIFAGFDNEEQMKNFSELFEIKIDKILLDIYNKGTENEIKIFAIDWHFVEEKRGFWKLDEIPKNAKKIKALSNGHIVDCYYTKINNTITLYRPNPNAKEIYKPLSIEDHIAYKKIYGTF